MVTIIKQSGNPVDEGDAEKFRTEWKKGFDKLFEAEGDMAVVSEKAQEYEEELMTKYDMQRKVDLPKSLKSWKVLLEKHQGPIMVDQNNETGDIVFIILDLGL